SLLYEVFHEGDIPYDCIWRKSKFSNIRLLIDAHQKEDAFMQFIELISKRTEEFILDISAFVNSVVEGIGLTFKPFPKVRYRFYIIVFGRVALKKLVKYAHYFSFSAN